MKKHNFSLKFITRGTPRGISGILPVIEIVGAAAIIVLLALLGLGGYLSHFKGAIFNTISPAQSFFYKATSGVAHYLKSVLFLADLAKQNQQLQEQNWKLEADVTALAEISRENKVLRKQLDLSSADEQRFILAHITGACAINYGQCMMIDKGSEDGVAENAAVTVAGDILIGRIIDVYDSTAKVLLINDAASAIGVIAQNSRANGVLRGNGNHLILEMIASEKNIEIGEKIITIGSGALFLRGLLVGEIAEIISQDAEATKRARIKPAAEINNLETIFIIRK